MDDHLFTYVTTLNFSLKTLELGRLMIQNLNNVAKKPWLKGGNFSLVLNCKLRDCQRIYMWVKLHMPMA
jgi:hypothetical protein